MAEVARAEELDVTVLAGGVVSCLRVIRDRLRAPVGLGGSVSRG